MWGCGRWGRSLGVRPSVPKLCKRGRTVVSLDQPVCSILSTQVSGNLLRVFRHVSETRKEPTRVLDVPSRERVRERVCVSM